jgi:hypothetical protein
MKSFSIKNKNNFQKKEKTDIDTFDKCIIKQTINEFHRMQRKTPNIKTLAF